jgi:hypothetical protein
MHPPLAESPAASSALPQRALRLAEASFLVQGANDRLLVTRDVRAALAMLLAAQSIVDQIDDATLADVRTALSGEIASLRDVTLVDIDATFARLQSLQKSLPDLPMRGARFVSTPAPATSDAAQVSTASLAWQKFLSLFAFHRRGEAARPPLGPDEATYLSVNLASCCRRRRSRLLRHDEVVYQQSLESVRRWLDDYLDTGASEVDGGAGRNRSAARATGEPGAARYCRLCCCIAQGPDARGSTRTGVDAGEGDMRRALIYLVVALVVGGAVGTLMARPGYVLVSYESMSLETSLWFAVLALIVGYFLLRIVSGLLMRLIRSGAGVAAWQQNRARAGGAGAHGARFAACRRGDWPGARKALATDAESVDVPLVNYLGAARAANEVGCIRPIATRCCKGERVDAGATLASG